MTSRNASRASTTQSHTSETGRSARVASSTLSTTRSIVEGGIRELDAAADTREVVKILAEVAANTPPGRKKEYLERIVFVSLARPPKVDCTD